MKDLIIVIASLLMIFIYVGNLKVSFKPLSVTMENWVLVVGYVALIIGVVLLSTHYSRKGYVDGYKDGSRDTVEMTREAFKNQIQ